MPTKWLNANVSKWIIKYVIIPQNMAKIPSRLLLHDSRSDSKPENGPRMNRITSALNI